jgi:hypothetical protein
MQPSRRPGGREGCAGGREREGKARSNSPLCSLSLSRLSLSLSRPSLSLSRPPPPSRKSSEARGGPTRGSVRVISIPSPRPSGAGPAGARAGRSARAQRGVFSSLSCSAAASLSLPRVCARVGGPWSSARGDRGGRDTLVVVTDLGGNVPWRRKKGERQVGVRERRALSGAGAACSAAGTRRRAAQKERAPPPMLKRP